VRLFSALYARAMVWARHPRAPYFLAGLSFAESSFFPIPPDVMLAPMALARPRQAWAYAAITTAASVVGGLAGYWEGYLAARAWFDAWGFWAIFVAGFSPIPYKLFTIAAGVIGMPLVPFVLASTIGRGGRFFLVAGLMARGGERMEKALHRYVDRIGWATVVALVVVYFWAR